MNKSRYLSIALLLSVFCFADNSDFLQEMQIPEVTPSITLNSISTRDFESIDFSALQEITGSKVTVKSGSQYLCVVDGGSYVYLFETLISSGYYTSNKPLDDYPLCHEGSIKLPFSQILRSGQTKSEVESTLGLDDIQGSVRIGYNGPVHDEDCHKSYHAYENLYIHFDKNVLKRAYYVLSGEPVSECM